MNVRKWRKKMAEEVQVQTKRRWKGISGSTLKMIAIVTMLIDHIGAVVLARLLIVQGVNSIDTSSQNAVMQWLTQNATLYYTYTAMRMIGRIAFPIFCFLLVEGFLHTHDVKKYALRLGAFALISEIPFDLTFSGKVLDFQYQNVFFTLFIGLLTMMVYHMVEEKAADHPWTFVCCDPCGGNGTCMAFKDRLCGKRSVLHHGFIHVPEKEGKPDVSRMPVFLLGDTGIVRIYPDCFL